MPASWPRASSPAYRSPRFLRGATSIQTLSQIFLVLQNSTLIMVMHHSRARPASGQRRYFISTAMMFVELTKLVFSLGIACRAQIKAQIADAKTAAAAATNGDDSKERPLPPSNPYSLSNITSILYQSLFASGSWMLILPAGLYALQTHLVYVAVSNMETVPFQVTYQLKILTTVLFSIVMLQRIITPRQWLALVLLTLGVAIVQVAETSGGPGAKTATSASPSSLSLANLIGWFSGGNTNSTQITTAAPKLAHRMNTSKGFFAAIAASLISGFTGVYFEKLIKESRVSVSLWTRNAQLSFFSLFPILLLGVWCKDGAAIAKHGFFVGYGPTVWATIGLQALGGILVAICITYADNVAKNLAASFSIVVSYMANAAIFGEPMTLQSTVGISTVLFALYLYQSRSSRSPPDSPLLPVDRDGLVDVRSKEMHEK
ncbi:UDP-galactose transporter Gms1 [Sporothrix stenoceras]|uniref:UDP-galactose transporter Gms1 n=1 Tax=Sporothrix stenoceras TaxID=5173 RepID=A0ABR3ZCZ4_9PEZI